MDEDLFQVMAELNPEAMKSSDESAEAENESIEENTFAEGMCSHISYPVAVEKALKKPKRFPILAPILEACRYRQLGNLWKTFKTQADDLQADLHISSFERFILGQKFCEVAAAKVRKTSSKKRGREWLDPVIPSCSEPNTKVLELLLEELDEAGCSKASAKDLAASLIESCKRSHEVMVFEAEKASPVNASRVIKTVEEYKGKEMVMLRYKSRAGGMVAGTTALVTPRHYNKLEGLLRYQSDRSGLSESEFDAAMLNLLLRYDSLAGGSKDGSGGGFQGAIHEHVFDVLKEHLDCRLECFASPLNARYTAFCSAFTDTDTAFGSLGSFFDFEPREGCYEANPPFVPVIVEAMVDHILTLLHGSGSEALSFVVVIPSCDSIETSSRGRSAVPRASHLGWQRLLESPFTTKHLTLSANEHGYCEGSQHKRPTRYKTSRFATSMFILQNTAAQAQFPCTDTVESQIRSAFHSRFEEELAQRQSNLPKEPEKKRKSEVLAAGDGSSNKATKKKGNKARKMKKDAQKRVP